jgi:hypothetical protein
VGAIGANEKAQASGAAYVFALTKGPGRGGGAEGATRRAPCP